MSSKIDECEEDPTLKARLRSREPAPPPVFSLSCHLSASWRLTRRVNPKANKMSAPEGNGSPTLTSPAPTETPLSQAFVGPVPRRLLGNVVSVCAAATLERSFRATFEAKHQAAGGA